MRWRVKKLSIGGAGGNGGTIQIASWKCNFSIFLNIQVYYLDIQAITILLCLLLILYMLVPSIYSTFYLTTTLLKKWCFLALKSLLLPLFSTYRHRTGFNVKRKQLRITNYLGLPINLLFLFFKKVAYFAPKKYALFKKISKIYCIFFSKWDNWAYVYMY